VIFNRKMNQATKNSVKRAITKAQETKKQKFSEKLDVEGKKGNVIRVAKQLV